MRVTKVIEAKHWKNKITGATASIYGAVPYMTTAEAEGWEIVSCGWTWENSNGTVGLGRVPAKTYEEAVTVMNRINGKFGCTYCRKEHPYDAKGVYQTVGCTFGYSTETP
jgi:hypothetical protein